MGEQPLDLHERILKGDVAVVAAVLAPFHDILVRRVRSLLSSYPAASADAEDAAQSALRTYLRRAGQGEFASVRSAEELRALLACIACRKAQAMLRKRRRERPIPQGSDDSTGGSAAAALPAGFSAADFRLLLEDHLTILPDEAHRAVALMCVQGHGQAEIAEILGCTTRNVRYKMATIRHAWRKLLEADS